MSHLTYLLDLYIKDSKGESLLLNDSLKERTHTRGRHARSLKKLGSEKIRGRMRYLSRVCPRNTRFTQQYSCQSHGQDGKEILSMASHSLLIGGSQQFTSRSYHLKTRLRFCFLDKQAVGSSLYHYTVTTANVSTLAFTRAKRKYQ